MVKPHAFVAMPFGTKLSREGSPIDFDRVYSEYIVPAVEAAGMEVFRADQEAMAGDIRTDMFQELLMADLVVVDLTIDNPNVWYELGIRHALRAKGVVMVCGKAVTTAFDVVTDRKLLYGLKDGGPDPKTVLADRRALQKQITETAAAGPERKTSPVYALLPYLKEPDWKTMRKDEAGPFWAAYEQWEDRVALARKALCVGDILVLADEAPVAALRAEAWIRAGQALRKANHFDFALELLDRGLEIEPRHATGLLEKGICLQRLASRKIHGFSMDVARRHYRAMLDVAPFDAELHALLARVDKDAWIAAWRQEGESEAGMREEAAYESALLQKAIEGYETGYRRNMAHYYSGINALTLMHLYHHLLGAETYADKIDSMKGAVRFAAMCEPDEDAVFWAKATLGDIEVLDGTAKSVTEAYKSAIARNENDWFALDACYAQLTLLKDLAFRPDTVAAGMRVFERALARAKRPTDAWQPRKVFLFSGHMVDRDDRETPRLPKTKLALAREKIAAALSTQDAKEGDLALTQGASGGDLLFTEACAERGVRVDWYQPFDEPEFICESVVSCGDPSWRERYLAAKRASRIAPESALKRLGPPPKWAPSSYAFERCNLWLLYTALSYGIDKVFFICLWDGEGGDGPGGTAHMYNEVKRRTSQVTWIDTRDL